MSVTIRDLICSHHRKTFSGANTEFTVHSHSKKRFEKHWSMPYPLLLCDLVQDIISHGPPLTSLGGSLPQGTRFKTQKDKEPEQFLYKAPSRQAPNSWDGSPGPVTSGVAQEWWWGSSHYMRENQIKISKQFVEQQSMLFHTICLAHCGEWKIHFKYGDSIFGWGSLWYFWGSVTTGFPVIYIFPGHLSWAAARDRMPAFNDQTGWLP